MSKYQTRTVLSLVLREYRSQHHLKQEQLATDLNIDIQTLRRWEQKEATLHDIRELKRIAVILGTDPEHLGVTTVAPLPLTSEEVDTFVGVVPCADPIEMKPSAQRLMASFLMRGVLSRGYERDSFHLCLSLRW